MADYDLPRPSSQELGSTELVVAKDNLITHDLFINDSADTVTTRKGKTFDSLTGFQKKANDAIQNAGGVALNGGIWAAGQTYTAYNEYMVYLGIPYKPKKETALPYGPVGAAPDTNFVQPYVEGVTADVAAKGEAQSTGLSVYPSEFDKSASTSAPYNSTPAGTNALRDAVNDKIYLTSETVSGTITAIDFVAATATVGGAPVTLSEYIAISTHSVGAISGYTFDTAADVATGALSNGHVVTLKAGDRIRVVERANQEFICGTLPSNGYNILPTNTSGVTAELIIKNGEYILEAWGVDLSGITESSDAWQALVYGIENSVPASTNAYSGVMVGGRGEIKINKPILFKQLDGISFRGAGKRGTGVICDGAMTPVLDTFFTSINGTGGRSYTYDQPCAFMIAASRKVGGADGYDDPDGAQVTGNNNAAWFYEWKDFYIKGASDTINLDGLTVNGFFGPTFAHGSFQNIDFQFCRAPIMVNDIFRTRISDCDMRNCKYPFDHATLNGNTAQGTSLTIENTGASRTIYGWKFFGLSYSTINAAIDDWGFGLTTGQTEYAYDLETCMGTTLISCGCENLNAQATPRILRLKGTQTVDIKGFVAKIVNYDNTANDKLYLIDGCNVNWDGGLPDGGLNATQYINIINFARVNFKANWKSSGENIIERILSDAFANINVDPYDEPYVTLYQGASNSAAIANGSDLTFPRADTNTNWGGSSGITNGPMVSTYEVSVSGSVSGTGWNRIELSYGGVSSNIVRCWLDPSASGPQPVNIEAEITVQPNVNVRAVGYTDNSANPIVLSGFTVNIRRVTGRTI